jgi:hypothetical protein
MKLVICTLYENHYHVGLAALTNSLYRHGYRGTIYAGYRGNLPLWAAAGVCSPQWPDSRIVQIADGLSVHFLPLQTNFHLTNYKPYFMLQLWEGLASDADAIAYFDPDIVVKCRMKFFENWIGYGVALVQELVNDPMPSSHPVRHGWKEIIEKCGREVTHHLDHYFNAGFCGVSRQNIEFIQTWCHVINTAIRHFDYKPEQFMSSDDQSSHFKASDQDALNITAMCCHSPISEVGPNGMDFTPGGWIMSHAAGSPKPWNKQFIVSSLKGIRPSAAEKAFWEYANGPIANYSNTHVKLKRFGISTASFIGRFYAKR